jgi:hypothetical protein
MRYLLVAIALYSGCASAHDWVQISSDYESSIYFDREGLKRDGAIVEVLLLWDFSDLQLTRKPIKPYLSAARLTRFDCAKGGRANIETTLYRENMAKGDVTDVYRTPDSEIRFEWVNPEAPGGESLRQVCAVDLK